MRLHKDIFIFKGARRYALYNTRLGFAAPLKRDEVEMLKSLASGVDPLKLKKPDLWPAIKYLRSLGAIEAGRPRQKPLDLEDYFKNGQKSAMAPGITQIWVELTNSCNLTCEHCYADSKRVAEKNELDFEQWRYILEPLLHSGVQKITFIGGEPMMRFDLMKNLIEYIRETKPGISIAIFTNLTKNFDESFMHFVRRHKIIMNTSLYSSNPQTHDQFTGKKGSWQKTVQNIKTLRSNGIDMFTGFIQLPEEPVSQDKIKEFIKSLDVTSFDIYSASKVGRGASRNWKVLSEKNTPPKMVYFNPGKLFSKKYYHNCFSNSVAINPQGEVFPCIMMRNISYGNAVEKDLHDILINDDFSKLSRLTKDKVEGCNCCEFRYACFDCRPDAAEGKNLYEKSGCGYHPDEKL